MCRLAHAYAHAHRHPPALSLIMSPTYPTRLKTMRRISRQHVLMLTGTPRLLPSS